MAKKPEITLLYRIAKSYYIDKLSQSQIAEMENISRSQISRLLERAEKLGLVTISVSLPEDPDMSELAESVAKWLKLREVIIAPVEDPGNREAVGEAIAVAAAQYLPKALKGCKIVGLGWGKTMYQMSLRMSYRNMGDELVYVPLVGLSGTSNPYLQINTIVDRVAERHRAISYFVGVPVFRARGYHLPEIEEKRIGKLEQYWSALDAAVIGLGARPNKEGFFVSEIDETFASAITAAGAVGDCLSQFFLGDGTVFEFKSKYQQIAYDIRRLHNIKNVICLAGGKEKIEGILIGARNGYFNTLVTDSGTARAFYDIFRQQGAGEA